jgi:ribose transport system permease protein
VTVSHELEADATVDVPLPARTRSRSRLRALVSSRTSVLIVFDGALFAGVAIVEPAFASLDNVRVLIDGMALQAIVAAAMAALLAAGRFDLSVDGVAALTGILTGKMMLGIGLPVPAALLLGLAIGGAIGLAQGVAVEHFRFNPVVISLAIWWLTTGTAFGLVETEVPAGFPKSFTDLGQTKVAGFLVYDFYALALVPLIGIVLAYTKFGYHTFATGGDRESARLKGIKVEHVGITLYVLVATTAAFAGIIFAARIDSAQPNSLDNMALNVIAAAVIGGAALDGGRASIPGTMLGLFLLTMLTNAAIFLGISPLWQKAISGLVLATAVTADAFSERQSDGRRRWRRPDWWRPGRTTSTGDALTRDAAGQATRREGGEA